MMPTILANNALQVRYLLYIMLEYVSFYLGFESQLSFMLNVDADCNNGTGMCDVPKNRCIYKCLDNEDCENNNPTHPICDSNLCVQCTTSAFFLF